MISFFEQIETTIFLFLKLNFEMIHHKLQHTFIKSYFYSSHLVFVLLCGYALKFPIMIYASQMHFSDLAYFKLHQRFSFVIDNLLLCLLIHLISQSIFYFQVLFIQVLFSYFETCLIYHLLQFHGFGYFE